MKHPIRVEEDAIEYYERKKGMNFKHIDGVLYVKTEMGCWKIVYTRKEQYFVLYHRNSTNKQLDFEKPQNEMYHRQIDVPKEYTIEKYLNYIYEHDRFQQAEQSGQIITEFSNKKIKNQQKRVEKNKLKNVLIIYFECQKNRMRDISSCVLLEVGMRKKNILSATAHSKLTVICI